MKKTLCITFIYLFVLAAPLNSSEYGNPEVLTGPVVPDYRTESDTGALADNLSVFSSGVVKALVEILDAENSSAGN